MIETNQLSNKTAYCNKMIKTPKSLQEKKAVNFAVALIEKYGYGYTVRVPSRKLSAELREEGFPISYITIIEYWKVLEKLGYVKREMTARINGVTYYLNRYVFKKLIGNSANDTI